jgi:pimeloyl-ACP methyl ester carboxylesterase
MLGFMREPQTFGPAHEYFRDSWQRGVMFLDVLRRRGNRYREDQAKDVPHVLEFDAELIIDGRKLPRPVNYGLVRIQPLEGVPTDPAKRPFVVVDPRAGHGPGIGGMKRDSEIGVALEDGHPCYFIGFTPEPMPGQTIEDVWNTEAEFVREVGKRHPGAGKPVVIGNCQAGWQTMIMAATHPEVAGPLLLVGAPLSYWAGVHGKNPMRYLGGLLGGSWLTSFCNDLGGGTFDGANLVANFEAQNLPNTFFQKPYNVFSNIDTEAERFLEFETWWGSPVLMNGAEIQWIVDNLFIGNKLTSGELRTSDGLQVDIRNVQSPIVIFCSAGDNITPPQQALGWITDIYRTDEDLIANGQTIVYSIHENVGHLGIFVSGKVANREHDEFASAMDMIDLMPPGLYEAVIDEVVPGTKHRDLIEGQYLLRLAPRTLDDIRALGANTDEDDRKFAAVNRISTINRQLYQTFTSPVVRAMVPTAYSDWLRQMHPSRIRFAIFSDENPLMRGLGDAAAKATGNRQPADENNIFRVGEKGAAEAITSYLAALGSARDAWMEQAFHLTYGSPLLQAMVGLDPKGEVDERKPEKEALREAAQAKRRRDLGTRFEEGGPVEAALRSIAFVRRAEGGVDERSYAMLKQLHDAQPSGRPRTMAQLKDVLRDQAALLRADERRAIETIPSLLPKDAEERARTLRAIQRVLSAQGELSAKGKKRMAQIEKLFSSKPEAVTRKEEADVRA